MEYAPADEAVDMGAECIDTWSWEVLTSLYGEIDLSLFAEVEPCDYSADQEISLEQLFTD